VATAEAGIDAGELPCFRIIIIEPGNLVPHLGNILNIRDGIILGELIAGSRLAIAGQVDSSDDVEPDAH